MVTGNAHGNGARNACAVKCIKIDRQITHWGFYYCYTHYTTDRFPLCGQTEFQVFSEFIKIIEVQIEHENIICIIVTM